MSTGFIATAPTAPDEGQVTSDTFWPAISLADLRDTVRLDGTVTTARLKHAVIDAITSVNRDLADWRRAREAEGSPPWPPYRARSSMANRRTCTATGAPSMP